MKDTLTQAESAFDFVSALFQARKVYERFNEIDNVDCNETSEDLCRIVFHDGSVITINPANNTVEIE